MMHDFVPWDGPGCGHVTRCGRLDAGLHEDVDWRALLKRARRWVAMEPAAKGLLGEIDAALRPGERQEVAK